MKKLKMIHIVLNTRWIDIAYFDRYNIDSFKLLSRQKGLNYIISVPKEKPLRYRKSVLKIEE